MFLGSVCLVDGFSAVFICGESGLIIRLTIDSSTEQSMQQIPSTTSNSTRVKTPPTMFYLSLAAVLALMKK